MTSCHCSGFICRGDRAAGPAQQQRWFVGGLSAAPAAFGGRSGSGVAGVAAAAAPAAAAPAAAEPARIVQPAQASHPTQTSSTNSLARLHHQRVPSYARVVDLQAREGWRAVGWALRGAPSEARRRCWAHMRSLPVRDAWMHRTAPGACLSGCAPLTSTPTARKRVMPQHDAWCCGTVLCCAATHQHLHGAPLVHHLLKHALNLLGLPGKGVAQRGVGG